MDVTRFIQQMYKKINIDEKVPIFYSTNDPEDSPTLCVNSYDSPEYPPLRDFIFKHNPFKKWVLISKIPANEERGYVDMFWGVYINEITPSNLGIGLMQLPLGFTPEQYLMMGPVLEPCSFVLNDTQAVPIVGTSSTKAIDLIKEQGVNPEELYGSHVFEAINQVYQFLKYKTSGKVIVGKDKQKIQLKTTDKKKIKFKGISYLSKYCGKVVANNYTGHTTSPIEWEYSFLVSGHWRNIAGIGKDREGEYNTEGHTWVIPHKRNKGSEHKENIRIVKGGL